MEATETATITYTQAQMVAYFEARMRFAHTHMKEQEVGSTEHAAWAQAYGAYALSKLDAETNSFELITTIY